jgi:hypothetical protein
MPDNMYISHVKPTSIGARADGLIGGEGRMTRQRGIGGQEAVQTNKQTNSVCKEKEMRRNIQEKNLGTLLAYTPPLPPPPPPREQVKAMTMVIDWQA